MTTLSRSQKKLAFGKVTEAFRRTSEASPAARTKAATTIAGFTAPAASQAIGRATGQAAAPIAGTLLGSQRLATDSTRSVFDLK